MQQRAGAVHDGGAHPAGRPRHHRHQMISHDATCCCPAALLPRYGADRPFHRVIASSRHRANASSPQRSRRRVQRPLYTRFTNKFGASISETAMRPHPTATARSSRSARPRSGASCRCAARRVRPHCRLRNRGTDPLSESGVERVGGCAKRQCDRALAARASVGAPSVGVPPTARAG